MCVWDGAHDQPFWEREALQLAEEEEAPDCAPGSEPPPKVEGEGPHEPPLRLIEDSRRAADRLWTRVLLWIHGRAMMAAPLLILFLLASPASAQKPGPVTALRLSSQASRYLELTYATHGPREFLACLIGRVEADTAIVERVAPADVGLEDADSNSVRAAQGCAAQGWTEVLGTIHSHPAPVGDTCSHYWHGTRVWTSDLGAYHHNGDVVGAIYCGDRVVWVNRALTEQSLLLGPPGGVE